MRGDLGRAPDLILKVIGKMKIPATLIVVTEGLAPGGDHGEVCRLSDHFQAVLDRLVQDASSGDTVFVAPGNRFGCDYSEEEFALAYLSVRRKDICSASPPPTSKCGYVDTFDNARLLRFWLEAEGAWPLGEVTLYCNAPHVFRSRLLFSLCGFRIRRVIGCHLPHTHSMIVPRLWFYNYPLIQVAYECVATVYGLLRWFLWRVEFSPKAMKPVSRKAR